MHLGSQESWPIIAAILSVIARAQSAGHNVRDRLKEVFEHLCDPSFSISEQIPSNWKHTNPKP